MESSDRETLGFSVAEGGDEAQIVLPLNSRKKAGIRRQDIEIA